MGLEILHFQQAVWHQCCWSMDHTENQGASVQFYKGSSFVASITENFGQQFGSSKEAFLSLEKINSVGGFCPHRQASPRVLIQGISRKLYRGQYGTSFIWSVAFLPYALLYFCYVCRAQTPFKRDGRRRKWGGQEAGEKCWGSLPASC